VIAGNAVIAGFDNGHISSYEVDSGSVLWDILLNPPSGRTEIERLSDLNSTVTVVGDDLYVTAYQGSLSSLARESGQTLWSREVSSYNGAAADFINVYVTDQFSELHAMSRRSGRETWKVDMLRQRDVTGPAVVGNSVVVADFEGYVHWFSASNGELQARMKAGGKQITAAPLVVGNTVYVLNEAGKLYAFRERPAKQ
jgi:outer membrane protein assembly factor BamB